jgi:hypothetical protein
MAGRLTQQWLTDRLAGAPAALVQRASEFVGDTAAPLTAERLAAASRSALEAAVVRTAGRGAALDLLAADALVTLALAAQVETEPTELAEFARGLRGQKGARG